MKHTFPGTTVSQAGGPRGFVCEYNENVCVLSRKPPQQEPVSLIPLDENVASHSGELRRIEHRFVLCRDEPSRALLKKCVRVLGDPG